MLARLLASALFGAATCLLMASCTNARNPAGRLAAKADYFPIAVWLQDPANAQKYHDIGINTYVGLYRGPTPEQLETLERADMQVACDQNQVSLDPRWKKVVIGWLQNDEPDNAQSKKGGGEGYDPPVLPSEIVARYEKMKAADPLHRPVMLNLGMGVAWDGWYGRGTRANHPEDYPQYVAGGDVVSFDIYPVCSTDKAVTGKISYVGNGVKRLVAWVDNKKPVWTCIETTHIGNPNAMVTPKQVRDEVWMAIINGARGIIYFAHEFKPKFIEAGLLAHTDIAEAVKNVDAEVQGLASVINEGKPVAGAAVDAKGVTMITRRFRGQTYIFATGMEPGPIQATFTLPGMKGQATLEVIGESRTVDAADGKWPDTFTGYEAHIYHVQAAAK
jgi:hypothetical protein